MGTNLADLDRQVLLLVAQHLILLSSAERPNDKLGSRLSSFDIGPNNAVSSSLSQQRALRSRTQIHSLLNLGPEDIHQHISTKLPPLSQWLCEAHQCRPRPAYILPLLLTCRKVHDMLSVEGNPELYKWLYEKTFDTAAVKRRWNKSVIPSWHFQDDDNESASESDHTYRATKRRKSDNSRSLPRSSISTGTMQEFDLEQNHSLLAEEYRDRMKTFRRFRSFNSPAEEEAVIQETEVDSKEDPVHVFWTIWWMVTEHGTHSLSPVTDFELISDITDEKNIPLLHEMMDLEKSSTSLFRKLYLDDVTGPGLPPSTVIKAIGAWLAVRLDMVTMYEDTPEHVDEKVFALTPFALASFKVCLVDYSRLSTSDGRS